MEEPLTDELLKELLNAPSAASFVDDNNFIDRTLSEYLAQLLEEKGLKQAEVIRKAQLDVTFGYQIFKGTRHPKRDKVLQLAFALDCSLQETNRLLQAANCNELYCKNRRDAIIIYAITHHYGLFQVEDALYRFGEETIL